MGNCLVTRLKGIVENDNLEVFGTLVLEFEPSASSITGMAMYYKANPDGSRDGVIAELKGGATFADGSTTSIFPTNNFAPAINSNGKKFKLVVYDKYRLESLIIPQGLIGANDIQKVNYLNSITSLKINGGTQFTGDMEGVVLPNCEHYLAGYSTKITGNVGKIFGKWTALAEIENHDASGVTGSVEDFVAAQIAAGRDNATIKTAHPDNTTYQMFGRNIKFNNGTAGGGTLVWSAQGGNNYRVTITSSPSVTATYNKSTGQWSYE